MTEITKDTAVFLRDHLVTALEGEHERFLAVVAAAPDSMLVYRPEDRLMSFGRLALHVASAATFFLKLVENGETPSAESPRPQPEVPATTAELVEACRAHLAPALEGFRALDVDALVREVPFYAMGSRPGLVYMEWHNVHLIHHRGQMTTYLRVAGAKVPSVYGPTADSTFEEMNEG